MKENQNKEIELIRRLSQLMTKEKITKLKYEKSDLKLSIDKNTQFELGYRGNFSDLDTDYKVLDIRNNETTRNLNLSN